MANTYTQLYYHIVCAVQGRTGVIDNRWKDELYRYITGMVSNQNHKMLQINGTPDHIHILMGTKPNSNLSTIVRGIKANSSKWINSNRFVKGKFSWQSGFGAFTVSQSQVKTVATYIENQEAHHSKKTFREEYVEFLKLNKIEYDESYIFD